MINRKLYREEIEKYPEFHSELYRLCKENLGPYDKLNFIDFVTDAEQSNHALDIFALNIRYNFTSSHCSILDRGETYGSMTIDSFFSKKIYLQLSEGIKGILRDKKLKELEI